MPVKKATAKTKEAPKKAAAKKATPAKKAPAAPKQKVGVGSVFSCKVCGLAVSVIEDCGCIEVCDLICCEEPMKPKRTRAA